jgi:hypothetical protein
MEARLTLIWGMAVPLFVAISPILALMIVGGGNSRGLGKTSKWSDYTSFKTVRQATSGRTNYK